MTLSAATFVIYFGDNKSNAVIIEWNMTMPYDLYEVDKCISQSRKSK
jgi:hypothetical protein